MLLIMLVIVAASVLFTNNLTRQLAREEQQNMAIWAEATRQLILADEQTDIDFISTVIENNTTIPVYMTDADGQVLSCRNVEKPVSDPRTLNGPIVLCLAPGRYQYIYYDESNLLRQLHYVPYIQFALIFIFISIAIGLLLTTQRSEQNRLWVGLSKETAHQLGTPISSLNAWQQLLSEQYPNDPMIPQMAKDIDRLHSIADRFSKIGSEPEMQRGDWVEVIEDSVAYMRRRIPAKVRLEAQLGNAPCPVRLCAPLMQWVIENLIKNAIDAMGGQAGTITLTLQTHDGEARLDVADTGKGMDKRTRRRIFQPGFTTKKRGWGLGLPLAKRIVEQYHGGKLTLESSKVNEGTAFRIVLKQCKDA